MPQCVKTLLIRGYVLHCYIEPAVDLVYEIRTDDIRVTLQVHPDACLPPKPLSHLGIVKVLISEGLQRIHILSPLQMDQIHHPEPAFSQNPTDLVLLPDEITFPVGESGRSLIF
jgi:hypothetical protein